MPYQTSWNSLKEHMTPKWLKDAKFGIYTHWGPYSVHACGPNTTWYAYHMYYEGSGEFKRQTERFGHPSKFGYKDFVPLFRAERFDADEWAELFRKSGARFAGPVGEHHDGFTMWDTRLSPWNAAKMGPKRDIVAELERSIRGQGMKYMVALHHAENWWYFPHWLKGYDLNDPQNAGLYGEPHDTDADFHPGTPWHLQAKPSKAFLDKWLGKTMEVIDGYHPDLLWFDFGLGFISEHYRREFLAYYYNRAAERNQEVAVAYKFHNLAAGCGLIDLELGRFNDLSYADWITDTTVDDGSAWGYMEGAAYKSAGSLVRYLVDNVSKNGYMLLNVGPRADGVIPDEAKDILLDMGRWLEVNGEAIFGTTPWVEFGEGPTKMEKTGMFSENEAINYTGKDFRFTAKDDALYAVCMAWPGEEAVIECAGRILYEQEIDRITMLGAQGPLPWRMTDEGLKIGTPKAKPCDHAFVFKIERRHPFAR